MASIHWTESLNEEARKDLYELYLVLFNARGLELRNKQRAFEAAADGRHTWSITGITRKALIYLCTKGTCDGLRRAHRVSRIERAAAMFTERLDMDALFEHFFKLDEVVLALAEENGRHGDAHWSPVVEVPAAQFTRPGMKAVASDADLTWAAQALEHLGIRVTPEFTPKRRRRKQ